MIGDKILNLDYSDHIDGKYYFTLSDKEKKRDIG